MPGGRRPRLTRLILRSYTDNRHRECKIVRTNVKNEKKISKSNSGFNAPMRISINYNAKVREKLKFLTETKIRTLIIDKARNITTIPVFFSDIPIIDMSIKYTVI